MQELAGHHSTATGNWTKPLKNVQNNLRTQETTSVYYCQKGRAAWQFLILNTAMVKPLYTTPAYRDEEEANHGGEAR